MFITFSTTFSLGSSFDKDSTMWIKLSMFTIYSFLNTQNTRAQTRSAELVSKYTHAQVFPERMIRCVQDCCTETQTLGPGQFSNMFFRDIHNTRNSLQFEPYVSHRHFCCQFIMTYIIFNFDITDVICKYVFVRIQPQCRFLFKWFTLDLFF